MADEKKSQNLDGIAISLRAFKNRDLTTFSKEQCKEVTDKTSEWCIFNGIAEYSAKQTQKRNDAHRYYHVNGTCTAFSCIPCRTLIMIKIGNESHHFNFEYKTVQVAAKQPQVDGLVLADLTRRPPEAYGHPPLQTQLSKLPGDIWIQQKLGLLRVLLKLSINKNFDSFGHRDDATGEGFPYVLSSFYIAESQ